MWPWAPIKACTCGSRDNALITGVKTHSHLRTRPNVIYRISLNPCVERSHARTADGGGTDRARQARTPGRVQTDPSRTFVGVVRTSGPTLIAHAFLSCSSRATQMQVGFGLGIDTSGFQPTDAWVVEACEITPPPIHPFMGVAPDQAMNHVRFTALT